MRMAEIQSWPTQWMVPPNSHEHIQLEGSIWSPPPVLSQHNNDTVLTLSLPLYLPTIHVFPPPHPPQTLCLASLAQSLSEVFTENIHQSPNPEYVTDIC